MVSTRNHMTSKGKNAFGIKTAVIGKFSRNQRRRIRAMINNGMEPEAAMQKVKNQRCPRKKSKMSNPQVPTVILEQQCPSQTSCKSDYTTDFNVGIIHRDYPNIYLSMEQMEEIKKSLLEEIDRKPSDNSNLGFFAIAKRDGWLSLSCCNNYTMTWIKSCVPVLPYPDVALKVFQGDEPPKTFVCITYIPPEAVLPPVQLLQRLANQNGGLHTIEWSIIRVEKERNGGETIIVSMDEASRNKLVAQDGKLYLNFTQIQFGVEKDERELPDFTVIQQKTDTTSLDTSDLPENYKSVNRLFNFQAQFTQMETAEQQCHLKRPENPFKKQPIKSRRS